MPHTLPRHVYACCRFILLPLVEGRATYHWRHAATRFVTPCHCWLFVTYGYQMRAVANAIIRHLFERHRSLTTKSIIDTVAGWHAADILPRR